MALSSYRPIRTEGGYAPWLAEGAGVHGVYVIRERLPKGNKRAVLYVGESHTARLRETLQRHFQQWSGRTAGPTFDPFKTEAAIEIFLDGNEAIRRQNALIRKLKPVHNIAIPGDEPAPRPQKKSAFDEVMDFFGDLLS